MKLPVWLLVMVMSETGTVAVGSLAESFEVLTSPPPETVTVLVIVAGALGATLTVRVIGG